MMQTLVTSRKRPCIGFYLPTEACRIAMVPTWTLNYWKRNGIIIPTVKWTDELDKEHLGHTFETVVFMRLIRLLREQHINLHNTVNAMQQLKQRFGSPSIGWANARIFVDKNDAYVYEEKDRDTWGTTVSTRYNQRVMDFIFGDEFALLKERADALLIPSQFMDYVEIDPNFQNGLPIVLNTTILTNTVHTLKQQGYEFTDIHDMYPFIPVEKIEGAEGYETFLDRAIKQPFN